MTARQQLSNSLGYRPDYPAILEAFEERAGIMEFDGGMTMDDAEQRALECAVKEWRL